MWHVLCQFGDSAGEQVWRKSLFPRLASNKPLESKVIAMSESLFDSLGGAEKVHAMVGSMYEAVLQDPELAPFFAKTDLHRLRQMQYEFIASALGGPVNFSGSELQAVHAGRGIQPQHFAKFVGYLADAMELHGATKEQVDAMLGKIAMFRDRVVGASNVDG